MQHFEACNEVSYIRSVNPFAPGKTFNHDPACFDTYRQMQAKTARKEGYDQQADQMLSNGAWRDHREAGS